MRASRPLSRVATVLWLVLVGTSPAPIPAAQVNIEESVAAFHRNGIEPASNALASKDASGARRLVENVTRAFQALPPALRTAQATNVQRLARGYMEMRLHDEAVALLDLSAKALDAAAPIGNQSLALVLADMARAHRLAGRSRDAEPLLNRAQALRGATVAADADAFPIQVELAELRRERGDLAGAESLLRPLIAAADRMGGWEYVPNLVAVFEAYAALLTQRGESNAARTFTARAETIRSNMTAAEEQMRRFLQRP